MLVQGAQAATRFLPLEKLKASEIIVVAQVYATRVTGSKTRRGVKALIVQNELKVLDTLKGTWPPEEPLFLNTYRYEEWMEDNVELPPVKSKVLLFLRRGRKGYHICPMKDLEEQMAWLLAEIGDEI